MTDIMTDLLSLYINNVMTTLMNVFFQLVGILSSFDINEILICVFMFMQFS